jgi:hypothetical protein
MTDPTRARPPIRFSPPRRPEPPATPKHVIEEYRHRHLEVTCVCGWVGSTATTDGRNSDWSAHVAANRPRTDRR